MRKNSTFNFKLRRDREKNAMFMIFGEFLIVRNGKIGQNFCILPYILKLKSNTFRNYFTLKIEYLKKTIVLKNGI